MTGQMDEGMVPVSLLWSRYLQQWEYEVKTMQREEDKDGVRFTSINHPDICKHGSQAARDEDKPTYSCVVLLRFPRLSGMVPVSWLEKRSLQQWQHEWCRVRIY